MDTVKTPNGYIRVSEIETFHVNESPGYHDHQKVMVRTRSGRTINTGMYERGFLAEYEKALRDD